MIGRAREWGWDNATYASSSGKRIPIERILRAMLERDGFDVVGDASSTSQLARVLTDERPDIVVLDDIIGVDAVEVVTEIVPDARLVVIWPAAVMPIAGAVRVEPSEVATTLTATVALAAGLSGLGATDCPEWIERVKKDPANTAIVSLDADPSKKLPGKVTRGRQCR